MRQSEEGGGAGMAKGLPEKTGAGGAAATPRAAAGRGLAGELATMRDRLVSADLGGLADDDRLEVLHQLELLQRAAAGLSSRVQVEFYASQVAQQVEAGTKPSRAGKGVSDDLARSRMCSPYWGSRDLTSAKALVTQMPRTLTALETGTISSYQARIITEVTACLSQEDRAEVDERLQDRLPGIANRELEALARGLLYEVDPAGWVERARKAAADRGVSVRPAPDVMAILSARMPAVQAVAVFACLDAAARAKQASGDPRTLGELRADELYERATGRSVVDGVDIEVGLVITDAALLAGTSDPAELIGYGPIPADLARELLRPGPQDAGRPGVGGDAPVIEVEDADEEDAAPGEQGDPSPGADERSTSSATEDDPGPDHLLAESGHESESGSARETTRANAAGFAGGRVPEGCCPAGGLCTDPSCTLLHGHPTTARTTPTTTGVPDRRGTATGLRAARVWLRRLYTDPVTGVLVARDPRKRLFTGSLRAFIVARDRTCRNAWCGAPIRTIDHILRHRDDGQVSEDNGRGLCSRCNLARERPRHADPPPESYRPPPPVLPIWPRPGPASQAS